ncbi:protein adenylyltransferase SelO [Agrobacterium vitis]|uniref:protein adenylyltransferase SelO n=1 Tax=Agrobacterium vitis TaxID=373 RepID=UPI001572FA64|nr:YdiU family protein [Agrobacterium vitis]NSY12815.1 YdiU family protein [Agrobacterium vitis]NSY22572.1 YdiU family protein [Agrobacterium vitis]NTA22277.1 YdiU family protein [Agrobacterium vitis]WEO70555.1 YdiU family protein [Agrobacterium vitis]
MFAFDNSYARLPEPFHAAVLPQPVAQPKLIRFNHALAQELGLQIEGQSDAALAEIFSGNRIVQGASPLAMAYAGHQFGNFVPQLGDGRAILLGEVLDRHGRRRDVQLKGAGPTPFSRNGDGRAALGPVIREYIVSEAMHALGLPTTRALAAVATGQPVRREVALPGAVLTRVAASHIRVGTFQFFAARQDNDSLKALADHVIDRHYPILKDADNRYLALLNAIADRQAALIARWLSIGFIHGVMNTDNVAVSGETIDFGPCAFLDEYNPKKVFSSIDQRGRYAYANQPGIGQWNMARLAECLLPLFEGGEDKAVDDANAALARFGEVFQTYWLAAFRAKLGVTGTDEADLALINDFLGLMETHEADFTLTFRQLGRIAGGGVAQDLMPETDALIAWLIRWRARLGTERPAEMIEAEMQTINPALIPRNHRIEEAISAAVYDDYSFFERLTQALERPFEETEATADLRVPPKVEERVARTFCGT